MTIFSSTDQNSFSDLNFHLKSMTLIFHHKSRKVFCKLKLLKLNNINRFINKIKLFQRTLMYRHNPLPANISKLQAKSRTISRKSIVFSSPKIKHFLSRTQFSEEKQKMTKSSSNQKSLHRLDSKQKPSIMTPKHPKKMEMSTVAPDLKASFASEQIKQQKKQIAFFNVEALLRNRQTSVNHHNQNYSVAKPGSGIVRMINPNKRPFPVVEKQKSHQKIQIGHQTLGNSIANQCWQSYEGQVRDYTFDGNGTIYLVNGDKFIGFFRQGIVSGHGSYYRQGCSQPFMGVWSSGRLLQQI